MATWTTKLSLAYVEMDASQEALFWLAIDLILRLGGLLDEDTVKPNRAIEDSDG